MHPCRRIASYILHTHAPEDAHDRLPGLDTLPETDTARVLVLYKSSSRVSVEFIKLMADIMTRKVVADGMLLEGS